VTPADEYIKIALVTDEVQARLLQAVLEERGIPHLLRSYRDLAFDGLFQSPTAWGRVEAPPAYREEILTIIADLEQDVPPAVEEG
jgi:hypothetical protein